MITYAEVKEMVPVSIIAKFEIPGAVVVDAPDGDPSLVIENTRRPSCDERKKHD